VEICDIAHRWFVTKKLASQFREGRDPGLLGLKNRFDLGFAAAFSPMVRSRSSTSFPQNPVAELFLCGPLTLIITMGPVCALDDFDIFRQL
jgi:hypothetical protein